MNGQGLDYIDNVVNEQAVRRIPDKINLKK